MDKTINALQVTIGDGSFGGVASFLYTYYSHMDHSKVHFDFLYCGENSMKSKADTPVLEGSVITELGILKPVNNGFKEYRKLLKALKEFFDTHTYDIVHVNSSNPFVNMCVAYTLKGKTTYISHSHSTQTTVQYGSKLKQVIKAVIRAFATSYIVNKADALFACSDEAGEFLFGKKGIKCRKYRVINNAIDTSQFSFKPEIREKIRANDSALILGCVGRLSEEKNPLFAAEVFRALQVKRPDSRFWFIGEGEQRSELEAYIDKEGLGDKAELLGRRNDVSELMQAMDVLLFPSLREGFGIVAIEAQCSGLKVVASDRVPEVTKVTELEKFLSLSLSPEEWADEVLEFADASERKDMSGIIKSAGYDIYDAADTLMQYYKALIRKKNKI